MSTAERPLNAQLLTGTDLYGTVVQRRMLGATREVLVATANLKAMLVEGPRGFEPVVDAFARLGGRGVTVRLLHADKPSRAFTQAFARKAKALRDVLTLRVCPRVHLKMVMVDRQWVYVGSANMTGAGLGAKGEHRRNFEVGMGTSDPEVLDHMLALFEAIWSGAECAQCGLYDLCPGPLGPRAPALARRSRRKSAQGPAGITLGRSRRLPRLEG